MPRAALACLLLVAACDETPAASGDAAPARDALAASDSAHAPDATIASDGAILDDASAAVDGSALTDLAIAPDLLAPADLVALPDSTSPSDAAIAPDMRRAFRPITPPFDVDGDGHLDIAVAQPESYGKEQDSGAVYLYLGDGSGHFAAPTVRAPPSGQEEFGFAITGADVNGDGRVDLVVGVACDPYFRSNDTCAGGAIAVYFGGAGGLSTTPSQTVFCDATKNVFALAPAGDVNGDGYADIVVGSALTGIDSGVVQVFYGGKSGLGVSPTTLPAPDAGAIEFGVAVAGLGDVDGDGYGDLLAGAVLATTSGSSDEGRAYLYRGGPGGIGTTPTRLSVASGSNGQFGAAVAGLGDVNGDGLSDWAVSGPWIDVNGTQASGRVFVYYGTVGSVPTTPSLTLDVGPSFNAYFGSTIASAGDLDGDGIGDLAVAANGQSRVYLYLGGPSGLSPTPATVLQGAATSAFGYGIAAAGDLDGDGHGDLVIGAPCEPYGGSISGCGPGRAYTFLGSSSGALTTANQAFAPSLGDGEDRFGAAVW